MLVEEKMKKLLLIFAVLFSTPLSGCTFNKFTIVFANLKWENETVSNASDYYISDIPEKEGFKFDGWYKDADYTKSITKISAGTRGEVELYAKFSKEVSLYLRSYNAYNVTFNLNGGAFPGETANTKIERVTIGKGLNQPTIPDKYGFLFGGWYDNPEFSGDLFDFSQTINSNLNLYAKWVAPNVEFLPFHLFKINTTKTSSYSYNFYFVPLKNKTQLSTTLTNNIMDDIHIYIYDSSGLLKYTFVRTSPYDAHSATISNLKVGEIHRMLVSFDGFGSNTYNVSLTNDLSEKGYPTYSWTYLEKINLVYDKHFQLSMSSDWKYSGTGWIDSNNKKYTDSNGKSLRTFTENIDKLYLLTNNYKNQT